MSLSIRMCNVTFSAVSNFSVFDQPGGLSTAKSLITTFALITSTERSPISTSTPRMIVSKVLMPYLMPSPRALATDLVTNATTQQEPQNVNNKTHLLKPFSPVEVQAPNRAPYD